MVFLKHLKPLALLDRKMDAVTTKMSKDPNKRNPGIKMLRVGCHVEGIHLESRIQDEVDLNV